MQPKLPLHQPFDFAAETWASNLVGAPKSDLNWNQFGGTFGGPIRKNKIFYFVDYEGFRENYSTQFIETVPIAAEHNGVFYKTVYYPGTKTPLPSNTVPVSLEDPLGAKLLVLYPAANGTQMARNWYNSLQLKYEKRRTSGWYTLAAYTLSRAIDEAGAWGANTTPQIGADFNAEQGPQAQTPRHNFTLANTYELPLVRGRRFAANWNRVVDGFFGGWRLANILTVRTGLPLNVTLDSSGTNPATKKSYKFLNNNGGTLRPNRLGDPQSGISPEVNRLDFLNPASFQVQTLNTPGNSSRDVAIGPGLATLV